jgi:hypothetical protein
MLRFAILPSLMMLGACATKAPASSDSEPIAVPRCTGAPATDAFSLGNVSSEGDELLVRVTTGGGCAAHSFSACWDGELIDTSPQTIVVLMSHDAHGDPCDALLSHDLRIDLAPILESVGRPIRVSVQGETAHIAGTEGFTVIRD